MERYQLLGEIPTGLELIETGATNRKLGSDMADSVTGGKKDLPKQMLKYHVG